MLTFVLLCQALCVTCRLLHILCVVGLMVLRQCNRRGLFCAPVVLLLFAKVCVAAVPPTPELVSAKFSSCFTE